MSWDNKRPLTAKELEEEVRLAAESISEEQAIFSDVDGDSDAEDDLPVSSGFSTPNSGRNLKRNLRSFMNNNAAGPSHGKCLGLGKLFFYFIFYCCLLCR